MSGSDYISIGTAVALVVGLLLLYRAWGRAEREAASLTADVSELKSRGPVDRRIAAMVDLEDEELAAETDRVVAREREMRRDRDGDL